MYKIGIDVGSTYTKYCVIKDQNEIVELSSEKTPIRQKDYFEAKIFELKAKYADSSIVSCGYGRKNVSSVNNINELIALAKGVDFVDGNQSTILDIGGQDTKIIRQKGGNLEEFFINDKCAAGSGLFLSNVCNLLNVDILELTPINPNKIEINLSSVCAVFAQSEIVELISNNVDERVIVSAVLKHIFLQAKKLLSKIECDSVMVTGGLSTIKGIDVLASQVLDKRCFVPHYSNFLSAIGCALLVNKD